MRRVALAAVVLALTGCGADSGPEISSHEPELKEEGRTLYAENCAQCHGEDLRGTDQGPSFLSPVYEPGHHSDGAFLLAVQTGVRAHHWEFGDMPPVEGLTQNDVEAIIAYVRETQREKGFEP